MHTIPKAIWDVKSFFNGLCIIIVEKPVSSFHHLIVIHKIISTPYDHHHLIIRNTNCVHVRRCKNFVNHDLRESHIEGSAVWFLVRWKIYWQGFRLHPRNFACHHDELPSFHCISQNKVGRGCFESYKPVFFSCSIVITSVIVTWQHW